MIFQLLFYTNVDPLPRSFQHSNKLRKKSSARSDNSATSRKGFPSSSKSSSSMGSTSKDGGTVAMVCLSNPISNS